MTTSLHRGYVRVWHDGRSVYEHRLVAWQHGLIDSLDDPRHVHHLDHDKLNNHPSNLQALTPSEHAREHNPRRLDRPAIVRMYREGLSTYAIARRLGTGSGNVFAILNDEGVEIRPWMYDPEFRDEVLSFCDAGASKTRTAQHFGVGRATIYLWAREREDERTQDASVQQILDARASGL